MTFIKGNDRCKRNFRNFDLQDRDGFGDENKFPSGFLQDFDGFSDKINFSVVLQTFEFL